MAPELCVLRGGGDLATGVAWRLTRAGWPVIACELPEPLTVRRTVSLSSAVRDGSIDIEGMRGVRADNLEQAQLLARQGVVAVLVSPELPDTTADVIVDARLAKRNIDTTINDGSLVIGLGPGFVVGTDCHAVIETKRGHHLGRVLWDGSAAPNTGTPGIVAGKGAERVLRSPADGACSWRVEIGDSVDYRDVLGAVDGQEVLAPFDGVVRGLIADETYVTAGLKIGDVDPRSDNSACYEISDKALAIGGGVTEAVLTWLNQ
ncbi:MAG: selenium-dependent molybdenum cofactor biosynthesis protein YqeB [Acidimicrobiales bacterium]